MATLLLLTVLAILGVFVLCAIIAAHARLSTLNQRIEYLEKTFAQLATRIRVLEHRLTSDREVPASEPAAPVPAPAEPVQAHPPVPKSEKPTVAPSAPPAPAFATGEAAAHPATAAVVAAEQLSPLPAPPPPIPRKAPPVPPPSGSAFDWEGLVGVKLFSWIVGIALALAAVFFLRYSIAAGWLQPPVRVAIGVIVGVALLALCELRPARKYPVTANALDASAVAILFATFFAAHALWHLLSAGLAFLLMVAVTGIAVLLSVRRDSIFIAILGLLGGFSTPALLSTGENRPFTLFGYLLLLNAGLAWVAYQKKWPVLTAISLILTTIYQWAWVIKFLTAGQLSLSVGIFLIFPVLGVAAFALNVKRGEEAPGLFSRTANSSAALPLAFAVYMATVPGYGEHIGMLFGFLFCLVAGLCTVTVMLGADALHGIGALAALLVFAMWLSRFDSTAGPGVMFFISVFILFFLTAPLVARRLRRPLSGLAVRAQLAAPLLFFTFPALAFGRTGESPALLFAILFSLLAAVAWVSLVMEEGIIYLLAAIFAIAAKAFWSHRYLDLSHGLPVFTIFGLLYILVPVLSLRLRKSLRPLPGDGEFLGIAGFLLLIPIALDGSLSVPPWPFWAVMAIFDASILAASLCRHRGHLYTAAMGFSALLLILFAAVASVAPWPGATIVAAGVVSVLGIGGLLLCRESGIINNGFTLAAVVAVMGAELATIVAAELPGSPGVVFLAAAHLMLLAALLALSWFRNWQFLAPVAVLPATIACTLWQIRHGPEFWAQGLSFAACLYAGFVAYPLILGRKVGRLLEPHLAAVLASASFFFLARNEMLSGGFRHMIGVLPLAQAVIMGVVLIGLLRNEPAENRRTGRLALVAGTLLAFITVAIPLQLEKQWITIGWALEGMALAWLYRRIPHRGLLHASTGLMTAVFVRLALNPAIFFYAPRGTYPVWNWYLYGYLVSAAALITAGWFFSRTRDELFGTWLRASKLMPAGGVVLLFYLVNIEIADFYSTGTTITFNFSASIAQDLTYTLGWAVFALVLLGAGIGIQSRPARVASILLLAATVLKCFVHDLGSLAGLYRVGSLLGLAICLAAVALLLQKYVVKREPR